MRLVLGTILRLFFPERCKVCGKTGRALCARCVSKIPLATDLDITHGYAVFDYGNHIVRGAVRELKYHRRSEVMRVLALAAVPYITDFVGSEIQTSRQQQLVLVPIPQHQKKTRDRGFNQSEQLASWWAKDIPGTNVMRILKKTAVTIPQAHMKNRTARLSNVRYTMKSSGDFDPKSIFVVVDDVTTTGATFAEAARALRESGAKKILFVALSHGYVRY